MVGQWLMHDDGFTIAQNQKTTLHYYGLAQTRNLCRYSVSLSKLIVLICPIPWKVPVQIVHRWLPMTQSRRWLNFQVVAWAGVLTSRNILVLYAGVLNVIHTWILHHKIMTCCCMLLLIPVLTVKVIQRGWKLQAASPCPHPERSSGMEPILYAVAAHPWSPTCSLLDFEQTSTQWVNSVHPTVTCHTQPTHASFLWRISTICQQRQCRSNSNQDRTSPFHMSLSSECYVLVLAGNWASVTWSDGGEGHLKGSIRPNNPKAASQRYTESHMQWSVGVPSSKLTERVELHV